MRAILTYHSIDPSGSPISIDAAGFRAHVAWLASGAVRVVTLDRLLAADDLDDAVALTFDDAFRNFADVAWPLLRAHGMPATLFVVSARAGTNNDWQGNGTDGGRGVRYAGGVPVLPLMDWDAIGRAAHDGVSLGAHSRTHPDLRRATDARLQDEIHGSAEDIAARTGQRPTAFAYPYGAVSARVAHAAAGFRQAVTTRLAALRPADDPLRLPRLDAFYFRDRGRLEAWGTPAFHQRLRWRAGIRQVRAALTGRPA